ncbi:GNAT family N-acetyltransferase [Escherichia coli]|uniref:GNAT family N-acetyltransferase n=1 Tax=Escherichia coli TaxID=562 RepID=UPI000859FB80|nr:GNAT family N-acetyltransferase [Escherichia coli]
MFTIKTDDLTHPAVQALVAYHISGMLQQSPPESSHALDVQKLRNPTVTFWSVWEGEQLAGIGALKLLDDKHGELKSMRTAPNYLRRGVASLILRHILQVAHDRCLHRLAPNYLRRGVASLILRHILQVAHDRCLHRLSLETGTQAGFTACHQLYLKHGFVDCEPFADYQLDPHSRFLSLTLCEDNELL